VTDGKIHSLISHGTYAIGGAAVVGGLTIGQWVAIGGFILMLANFCVNYWRSRKMVNLREREVSVLEQRK
jgi:hypothetical protein